MGSLICQVADALLKLKHPHGGNLADLMMYSPGWLDEDTKIVGPAYTVKFVSQDDTSAPRIDGHYVSPYQTASRADKCRSTRSPEERSCSSPARAC